MLGELLASVSGTKVGPQTDRTQPGRLDTGYCGLIAILKPGPQAAGPCPQWPYHTSACLLPGYLSSCLWSISLCGVPLGHAPSVGIQLPSVLCLSLIATSVSKLAHR